MLREGGPALTDFFVTTQPTTIKRRRNPSTTQKETAFFSSSSTRRTKSSSLHKRRTPNNFPERRRRKIIPAEPSEIPPALLPNTLRRTTEQRYFHVKNGGYLPIQNGCVVVGDHIIDIQTLKTKETHLLSTLNSKIAKLATSDLGHELLARAGIQNQTDCTLNQIFIIAGISDLVPLQTEGIIFDPLDLDRLHNILLREKNATQQKLADFKKETLRTNRRSFSLLNRITHRFFSGRSKIPKEKAVLDARHTKELEQKLAALQLIEIVLTV